MGDSFTCMNLTAAFYPACRCVTNKENRTRVLEMKFTHMSEEKVTKFFVSPIASVI